MRCGYILTAAENATHYISISFTQIEWEMACANLHLQLVDRIWHLAEHRRAFLTLLGLA